MKIFLIERMEPGGWDDYTRAVVIAEDSDAARNMHPGWPNQGGREEDWDKNIGTWVSPVNVLVTYLGEARPNAPAGVVCADFNAG